MSRTENGSSFKSFSNKTKTKNMVDYRLFYKLRFLVLCIIIVN